MKCLLIVICALLLPVPTFFLNAQTQLKFPAPVFNATPSSLDFGAVKIGSTKSDTVTVTNTGNGSLIIYVVATDIPEFRVSPDMGTIAASQSMKFIITFEPGSVGQKTANLIFAHIGVTSPDTVKLTGKAAGPPLFSPDPISVDFGDVTDGTRKTDSVSVTNTGWDTLRISNVISGNAVFTCSPSYGVKIAPGSSFTFHVTFYPLFPNTYASSIVFSDNTDGKKDSVRLFGKGTGPAAYATCELSKRVIDFGVVQTAMTATDSVIITNTGNAPLNFSGMNGFVPYPSCFGYSSGSGCWQLQAGGRCKLTFTFRPDVPRAFSGFMVIHHNAQAALDTIFTKGIGTGDSLVPGFALSTPSMDFGTIPNGVTSNNYFTITNTDLGTLSVAQIKVDPPGDYTVDPHFAFDVEHGANRQVTVAFAPMTDGVKNATVYIYHNAANPSHPVGLDSVQLTGVGTGGVPWPVFNVSKRQVHFDTVSTGMFRQDSLWIWNNGRIPLNIASTKSDNPRFSTLPQQPKIGVGDSTKIRIYFSPVVTGSDTAHIVFFSNATEATDTILATGTGVGAIDVPGFAVSRNFLDFGHKAIEDTMPKIDSFAVVNTSSFLLKIYSDSTSLPIYTIAMRKGAISPHDTGWMVVKYEPLAVGETYAWVRFRHNAPTHNDSVMVHGICDSTLNRAVPYLEPDALDFRGILVNTTARKNFAIHNYGQDTLVVSSITSSNPAFTFTGAAAVVPPLGLKSYELSFAPGNPIEYDGSIAVASNAREKIDTLNVRGSGVLLSDIAAVRAAPNGTDVAFRGVVTRARGAYTRIQDSTGGITIMQQSGAFASAIANYLVYKGDTILVLGRTSEQDNLKVVADSNINGFTAISHGNPTVVPIPLTLGEIAANGEQYESRLVSVHNITIDASGDLTFRENKTYVIYDTTLASFNVFLSIPDSRDSYIPTMPFLSRVDFTGVLGQKSYSPLKGYQIVPVDYSDLTKALVGVEDEPTIPQMYSLSNYPNPFSSITTITYAVPKPSYISLAVFDRLGRNVAQLAGGLMLPGTYRVRFDASRLPDGMYFYRLQAGGETLVGKIIKN